MNNTGEVIKQLLQVRAAIQVAMGLTNNAQNELRDARTRAGDATQGTGNPNALDGLAAWIKADAGAGELTAKLAKVDDDIAGYIAMIRTGDGGGTQSTLLASLTGEEILKQSSERGGGSRLDRLLGKALTNVGDVKDALDKPVELMEKVVIHKAKQRDPDAETLTGTEVPSPLTPPPSDSGDAVATLAVMGAAMVTGSRVVLKRIRAHKAKERKRE